MSKVVPDHRPDWLKKTQPFVAGGLAGAAATSVIQPVDMIKVRIQLAGESGSTKNPFKVGWNVVKTDGFLGLYSGLSAGIVRQLTYTTTRFGVFEFTRTLLKKEGETKLPGYKQVAAGLTAGAVGAFVGTPADLSLVRMQADTLLPIADRRNYKGVFDAFRTIVREEGVIGLWKGSISTVARAMSLNVGMLATFEQAKHFFRDYYGHEGWSTTLSASACSGFGASFMSLPFDFVKTKLQKMVPNPDGSLPFKGPLDCAMKSFRNEGPMAFYAGFPTFYARIAPHAMLVLIMVDRIELFVKKMYLPSDKQ